jgi:hypothetical protein
MRRAAVSTAALLMERSGSGAAASLGRKATEERSGLIRAGTRVLRVSLEVAEVVVAPATITSQSKYYREYWS